MNRTRDFAILVCLFVALFSSRVGAENPRDGNYWRGLSRAEKDAYVVGVYDGTTLGANFAVWKLQSSRDGTDLDAIARCQDSATSYDKKYRLDTTSGQIADGVDAFYEDYRNRRIQIWGAVWLVMNAIAGTPKAELDKRIESWRRNSPQ
jgi:hypothetical protein